MVKRRIGPRPTVWFDVDDCLTDTAASMADRMWELTGIESDPRTWTHLRLTEIYGISQESMPEVRAHWARSGMLEKARTLPHAQEALAMVKDAGLDVGLITARAWHPEGEELTRSWATENGLPVDKLILTTFEACKAALLAGTEDPIALYADDAPRHVRRAGELGIRSMMIRAPWNGHEEGIGLVGEDVRCAARLAAGLCRQGGAPFIAK